MTRKGLSALLALGAVGCLDFGKAESVCELGGRCAAALPADAGNDGGPVDAGALDAGNADAGNGDAGEGDAGTADAGDAGIADGGSDGGAGNCCQNPAACPSVIQVTGANSNDPSPVALTVDSQWVYWANKVTNGYIRKALHDGGSKSTIARADAGPPYEIATSPDTVYWVESSASGTSLWEVPLDGGGQNMLLGPPLTPLSTSLIADDGTNLYVLQGSSLKTLDGGLLSLNGGYSQDLHLQLTGPQEGAYWGTWQGSIDAGFIYGVTFANTSTTVPLATAVQPRGVTTDDTYAYWVIPDAGNTVVQRIRLDNTSPGPELLAVWPGNLPPQTLVVDQNALYWLSTTANVGQLVSLPLDGGPPSCVYGPITSPARLAQDAQSLYVSTGANGVILNIPKP